MGDSHGLTEELTSLVRERFSPPVYFVSWRGRGGVVRCRRFLTGAGELGALAFVAGLRARGVKARFRCEMVSLSDPAAQMREVQA